MDRLMPALLVREGGKRAFDDARTEAQATRGHQRLGVPQINEQALAEAR